MDSAKNLLVRNLPPCSEIVSVTILQTEREYKKIATGESPDVARILASSDLSDDCRIVDDSAADMNHGTQGVSVSARNEKEAVQKARERLFGRESRASPRHITVTNPGKGGPLGMDTEPPTYKVDFEIFEASVNYRVPARIQAETHAILGGVSIPDNSDNAVDQSSQLSMLERMLEQREARPATLQENLPQDLSSGVASSLGRAVYAILMAIAFIAAVLILPQEGYIRLICFGSLVFALSFGRLLNIGLSGWLSLLLFVPVINIPVTYTVFGLPADYSKTHKVDNPGFFVFGMLTAIYISLLINVLVGFGRFAGIRGSF